MPPETRYAKAGDINIAYQTEGQGEIDLLFVPGWVSHVEYAWEEPTFAPFLERMARFSRLILFDRRGTGLSDPVADLPTLEERMDDVRAAMDAAESERAFIFGVSESGPMCSLFAATYPGRTAGLILADTFANNVYDDDHPWAISRKKWDQLQALIDRDWGQGLTARVFAPTHAGDEAFVRSWARFERCAVSKGAMSKIVAMITDIDVRHVLPSIRVPTLVIHRSGDKPCPVEGGRYIAKQIPGAKFIEVEGEDHFPWAGDADTVLDHVEEFVTGTKQSRRTDQVVATVLFTDIVDSTLRLVELGDTRWRQLLDQFYRIIRQELRRFRGREIDTTGDGLFASFDGPARAIRCACTIRREVASLGIEIRAGLHTGDCEELGDKIVGIAVHVGARVCGVAGPNEVLVSSTVRDLVPGSGLQFTERGRHSLKGVPGEWLLFRVDAEHEP